MDCLETNQCGSLAALKQRQHHPADAKIPSLESWHMDIFCDTSTVLSLSNETHVFFFLPCVSKHENLNANYCNTKCNWINTQMSSTGYKKKIHLSVFVHLMSQNEHWSSYSSVANTDRSFRSKQKTARSPTLLSSHRSGFIPYLEMKKEGQDF